MGSRFGNANNAYSPQAAILFDKFPSSATLGEAPRSRAQERGMRRLAGKVKTLHQVENYTRFAPRTT